MTSNHNELMEVLDDRSAPLSVTFFQQITTFFQVNLGPYLPWLY
jgi:hypothetical protein